VYSHIGTKPWEFTGEEENEGASNTSGHDD
jgi:hypothetical protein